MRRRFIVEVIPEDYDGATRGDSHNCVIARAIRRKYPELRYVDVTEKNISFTEPGERTRLRWELDADVGKEILDWDNNGAEMPEGQINLVVSYADSRPLPDKSVEQRDEDRERNRHYRERLKKETKEDTEVREKINKMRRAEHRRGD